MVSPTTIIAQAKLLCAYANDIGNKSARIRTQDLRVLEAIIRQYEQEQQEQAEAKRIAIADELIDRMPDDDGGRTRAGNEYDTDADTDADDTDETGGAR